MITKMARVTIPRTCVYGKGSGGQASCASKRTRFAEGLRLLKGGNGGGGDGDAKAPKDASGRGMPVGGVPVGGDYGESCSDVCRKRDMACEDSALQAVNNCNSLTALFKCTKCERNEGPD